MKKKLILPTVMMAVLNSPFSLVNAKSKIFSSQKLEEARAEGLISLKTLMVKVRDISQFKRDYPALASWETFFVTKDGI